MQTILQVTFHGISSSAAVEEDVRRSVQELEAVFSEIVSCRVSIEVPHRDHHRGRPFRVAVDVGMPGRHLVAGRASDEDTSHEDVYVAIRDAFRGVRRQLDDYMRSRRGEVKAHNPGAAG
jgi:ribosome-associated translation inhibitor RaiA